MRLTAFKRLLLDDFPTQQAWIDKLLTPLNSFMEQVSTALASGLTVGDNLDAQIVQTTFLGSDTVQFKVTTRNRPKGVIVSNFETVTGTAPTAAVQPVWTYNSETQTVTVTSWFGGLTSTSKYRATLYIHTI